MQTLLLKFWKEILVVIVSLLLLLSIYQLGYNKGSYDEKSSQLEVALAQQKEVSKQVDNIHANVNSLILARNKDVIANKENMAKILKQLGTKNYITIKGDKCTIDATWVEIYNSIIKEGNK